jgi:hypothetical protein
MSRDLSAPIYTVTWDLCNWLLQKARALPHDVLAQALAQESLTLLDTITLALKDIEREHMLADTDLILIRLRTRLRLAVATELFNERQGEYALELADSIGRQLGGWQKVLHDSQ